MITLVIGMLFAAIWMFFLSLRAQNETTEFTLLGLCVLLLVGATIVVVTEF